MNAEQKQRALQVLRSFEQADPITVQSDNAAVDVAALLQELIDEPASVPVLTVECEPDYWSGGHYYEGTMPHIDPTAVWKLPIGTELYTSPPTKNQSEQNLEMVNAPAPSVPDGRKMVPDDPTAEMLEAGHRAAWQSVPSLFDRDDVANVYRAMLAAAPAARLEDQPPPADVAMFASANRELSTRMAKVIAALHKAPVPFAEAIDNDKYLVSNVETIVAELIGEQVRASELQELVIGLRTLLDQVRHTLDLSPAANPARTGSSQIEPPADLVRDAERWLSEHDLELLVTFGMQADDCDADGHTLSKEQTRRLCELGVLRNVGFGRHEMTAFGDSIFGVYFSQGISLPLHTHAEYNAAIERDKLKGGA